MGTRAIQEDEYLATGRLELHDRSNKAAKPVE